MITQPTERNARAMDIALTTDSQVLLLGPTGSGKSRLARWIHQNSLRSHAPFVDVNLATLAEGTFESELFGHEKGAFTGAIARRAGRLVEAHCGTLFLDEIGELTLQQQARILEFLQTKKITPIGSNREIFIDVRLIAATNRDLDSEVRAGRFRADLFQRLRFISVVLPSLAELADSFDEIVHQVLAEICARTQRRVLRLSTEVAHRLETYPWPGNFRELRHVLEYAVLASRESEIELGDLPDWFLQSRNWRVGGAEKGELGTVEMSLSVDYQSALSKFDRVFLERALARFQGKINRTSREIGMSKATLIRRIREHGIIARPAI